MSILTRERTAEERVSPAQLPEQAPARPLSTWPLPATRLPGAHFTWDEWVARLTTQHARELRRQDAVSLEARDDDALTQTKVS